MLKSLPDIIGINQRGTTFWVELKALDAWPARESTLPLKNAFEPGQVPFLKEWRGFGGWSYVLVKIGAGHAAQWMLLTPLGGTVNREHRDLTEMTRSDLINQAAVALGLDSIIEYLENL